MRVLAALLLAMPLAALDLTPRLADWKTEIERESGIAVSIAEVQFNAAGDEMRLPPDTPRSELMGRYLSSQEFAAEFRHMFAVMVHHKDVEPGDFLIMLNGARRKDFAGAEEAVIGHELGHAMLRARRYPTPAFVPGVSGCLAIHSGDIVQHILIRAELDRRGIAHVPFWLRSLDSAADAMAAASLPQRDRCARVRQVAQLVDVRLGLRGVDWAGREKYESAVRSRFPEVERTAGDIVAYLENLDVRDKPAHDAAVRFVFQRLKDLAQRRTKDYILENRTPRFWCASGRCDTLRMDRVVAWYEPRASAWDSPL